MDAHRKVAAALMAIVAALLLAAGPVVAAEDAPEEAPVDAPEEAPATGDDTHRRPIAETPRDRLGLLLLGALLAATGLAAVNARRQLRGERPQATGEFRWR